MVQSDWHMQYTNLCTLWRFDLMELPMHNTTATVNVFSSCLGCWQDLGQDFTYLKTETTLYYIDGPIAVNIIHNTPCYIILQKYFMKILNYTIQPEMLWAEKRLEMPEAFEKHVSRPRQIGTHYLITLFWSTAKQFSCRELHTYTYVCRRTWNTNYQLTLQSTEW